MRIFPRSCAIAAFALVAAIGVLASPPAWAQHVTMTADGLGIIDTKLGTGATPKPGQTVVVHYTGWLYQNGQRGKKFDSSVDRGQPFEFPLGKGQVIPGWEQGVEGMKVGGRRELIIPPSLGYGAKGSPPTIPANETLVFVVDLLGT